MLSFLKKLISGVMLFLLLSACSAQTIPPTANDAEAPDILLTSPASEAEALDMLLPFFEEPENRRFDISPATFQNEAGDQWDGFTITVNGSLGNGKAYLIDTFIVDSRTRDLFFYNNEGQRFDRFFGTPKFTCKTSPDGNLRIESIGMYPSDGPFGTHPLWDMRLIDSFDGTVLWLYARDRNSHFLSSKFSWSEDGRYVMVMRYDHPRGPETLILDSENYGLIELPGTNDILDASAEYSSLPREYINDGWFTATGWVSPTSICVAYDFSIDVDLFLSGEYEYDITDKTIQILTINKITREERGWPEWTG